MNKNIIIMASLAALALPLGGCSGNQEFLGRSRQAPDEFAVYSRAPLSMPPDFSLRPPGPGTTRTQAVAPRKAAKKAILGPRADSAQATKGLAGASPGTISLIRQTGGFNAAPAIRATVNRETSVMAKENKKFADKIIFWRDPEDPGKTIDPAREERRIRDASSKGDGINIKKSPAATVQSPDDRRKSKKPGFWDRLFN